MVKIRKARKSSIKANIIKIINKIINSLRYFKVDGLALASCSSCYVLRSLGRSYNNTINLLISYGFMRIHHAIWIQLMLVDTKNSIVYYWGFARV